MALSTSWVLVVAVATWSGGILSIVGSSILIWMVLGQKKHRESGYHRLLLGLSLADLCSSIGWILGPIAIPRENSERITALGSIETCSAAGFMIQLGSGSYFYNGMLSIYFLLVIRYGMGSKALAYREWIMHIVAIVFSISTAIAGVPLQLYNEVSVGLMCWIANYPVGCGRNEDIECTRGRNNFLYGYLFAGLPLLSVPIVVVCNILIYCNVRSIEYKQQQHDVRRSIVVVEAEVQALKAERTRKVATQAFLYVAAFLNCLLWLVVVRNLGGLGIATRETESTVSIVILVAQFLSPAQGLLNLLIYVRPRYLRIRERYNYISRWQALQRALRSSRKGIVDDLGSVDRSSLAAMPVVAGGIHHQGFGDDTASSGSGAQESSKQRPTMRRRQSSEKRQSIGKIVLLEESYRLEAPGRNADHDGEAAGWEEMGVPSAVGPMEKKFGEIAAIRVI